MASNGWSELGALLGGGNQLQEMQARQAGLLAGMRQASALEAARQKRDEAMGMNQVPQAIHNVMSPVDPVTGQPYMPEVKAQFQGDLVSAMLRAHQDPRQVSGYMKDQQGIDFRRDAMTAATDPNTSLDSLNRRMLVISGKPTDLTHVADGVAYNPMLDPHSQTIDPTQVGLAEIVARAAQAANSRASASEHMAQTRLADTKTAAGGFAPKDGGQTKPTLPPLGVLGAMLGQGYDKDTGRVTIPPDKMQHFLSWQAAKAEQDPRYNNGAFAAQHYASAAPLGTGVHDTPADVGATSIADMMRGAPVVLSNVAAPVPAAIPPAPSPATRAATQPSKPAMPASKANFDALPSGTLFINPADGRLMRKK